MYPGRRACTVSTGEGLEEQCSYIMCLQRSYEYLKETEAKVTLFVPEVMAACLRDAIDFSQRQNLTRGDQVGESYPATRPFSHTVPFFSTWQLLQEIP